MDSENSALGSMKPKGDVNNSPIESVDESIEEFKN